MARKDPDHDPLSRDNVPGSLDHASGEVDEFEAALVRGGDGEEQAVSDEDLARQAEAAGAGAGAAAGRGRGSTMATRDAEVAATRSGPGRFLAFLRASWAELQRVQWPNRRQVGQATAVVLGFVVIAGAYLGLADFFAEKLVDLII